MPGPTRPLALVLAAALAIAPLAACSRDEAAAPDDATTSTEAEAPASGAADGEEQEDEPTAEPIEEFDGPSADFYEVPAPLGDGPSGELLRYQRTEEQPVEGATQYRILYRSESVAGDPIAVSGAASVPTAEAPPEGRRSVTIAHGTTGIADECAPSRNAGRSEMRLVAGALGTDHLIAATDYEGLGTPGRHPYLVGESEGRSTIDAIVAARQLPDAEAGSKLAIVGYSQGGHGALWANQVAAERAPDLEVVGTFAGAPASEVALTLAAAPRLPQAGFAYMLIAGIEAAYPDEADLEALLTPRGIELLDAVDEGCATDVFAAVAGIPVDELILASGASSDPWRSLARRQDAGQVKTNDAPVLVIHSQTDAVVPPIFSAALLRRMCGNDHVIERRMLPEGSHTGAAIPAYQQAFDWLEARFSGTGPEPVSSCSA